MYSATNQTSSTKDKLSEVVIDFVDEVVEVGVQLVSGESGVLELHLGQLEEELLEGVVDECPGDLLLALHGVVDDSLGVIVELNDASHHTEGLVKGTVVIVAGEGVLLQEVLSDNLGYLY